MGCTGLYWALLGCIRLDLAVLGSTGLYLAVVCCSVLLWAVLGCTGLYEGGKWKIEQYSELNQKPQLTLLI